MATQWLGYDKRGATVTSVTVTLLCDKRARVLDRVCHKSCFNQRVSVLTVVFLRWLSGLDDIKAIFQCMPCFFVLWLYQ
ncbi:hypothetical protein CEXT_431251 [Caerostris extrusa]|uniref:Uncharacterized protein n=1 Tax=Caerostris extrusa TaxID=172846 RepID=A0AAV4XEZ8_CAEEX|nr:hypothetical protein CEXT_431251 [Caerostris extrusa]